MKVLTVRHPWAWAIINGGKDVENRSRRTNHRGQLYIHAAQALDTEGLFDPQVEQATDHWIATQTGGGLFGKITPVDLSTAGMVLGTVEVTGCHHADWCWDNGHHCSPWAQADAYHWELSSPRPLACPFPEKGKLGIWNLLTEETAQ